MVALSLATGRKTVVQRGGYFGRYLPGGNLVYVRDGALFGVAFDPVRLETKGTPVPLLDDIAGHVPSGGGQFDFSQTGLLVYLSGKAGGTQFRLGWIDAAGKFQAFGLSAGNYFGYRLSPDGKRLAFANGNTGAIWVYDLDRETALRVTPVGMGSRDIVWSRDGKHLVYSSYSSDGRVLWWTRSDGTGSRSSCIRARSRGRILFLRMGGCWRSVISRES